MTDSEIIALFFERSEQAIRELMTQYGPAVKRTARNILRDEQDAEECANDAYLSVWNTVPPKRPRSLGAYVCKIARNLAVSRCRFNSAQRRNSSYDAALDELEECVPALESVETAYDAKALAEAIDAFLDTLSREDAFMFLRRYWYADSVGDIAKMLHTGSHRVSVRLFRTREKLQDYLTKEGVLQ